MGADARLLLQIADTIGIDDDIAILRALGVLAGNWTVLADSVGGGAAPQRLSAIIGGAPSEVVAGAFHAIGADAELATLRGAAARLTAIGERFPDTMSRLLQPVGAFDETRGDEDHGLVRWSIDKSVDAASDGPADAPSYALSLGAGAALTLEAGAKWPYSDRLPGPLLRLRAEGSLKPQARATLPFTAGSVSAGASASAACAIEYFFAQPDGDTIFATAAASRLAELVDPFDFDAVWNGFATGGLMGLQYGFDGGAKVDVAVSLADAGALADVLKAQIGATLAVSFALEGRYFLTFRAGPRSPGGVPRIEAVLSREKRQSADLSLRVAGSIDLSGLATRLHAILAQALGRWDAALLTIKPFLAPGTLLRSKAGAVIDDIAAGLIKDAQLAAALADDLGGIIEAGEADESQLAQWLGNRLASGLDAAQGWAGEQAAAADRMLDALGRSLPVFAQPLVRQKLRGAASRLVREAGDALRTEVKAVFDANAKVLGKALKDLGAVADSRLADADAALAGVRDLIGQYDALFRKIMTATEEAATAKLSIALQIEEASVSAQTVEIAGSLVSDGPGAREAFQVLTRGNVGSLVRLLDATPREGFVLDPARSSLKRYASSTGKFGLDVVLIDFGASVSELIKGEASVLVDGTGTVQVDARGQLEKRFRGEDATREITLISSYSLVRARALATAPPAAERSIGLAISIGHIDRRLERREMTRFVGSVVSAGLVRAAAAQRAQDVYTRWSGNLANQGRLEATVQLKLSLDRTALANLLALGRGPGALADRECRAIIRTGFDALADSEPRQRALVDQTIAFLARTNPRLTLDDLLMDEGRTRRELRARTSGSDIRQIPAEHEPFAEAMRLAHGMLAMIEQMRAVYFSTPETDKDADPATWSPEDYRDAQRRAVKAVREWLLVNAVLFWTNSQVHPRTLAFLQTLASLARIDLDNKVSLILWRKGDVDGPETVVLTHNPARA